VPIKRTTLFIQITLFWERLNWQNLPRLFMTRFSISCANFISYYWFYWGVTGSKFIRLSMTDIIPIINIKKQIFCDLFCQLFTNMAVIYITYNVTVAPLTNTLMILFKAVANLLPNYHWKFHNVTLLHHSFFYVCNSCTILMIIIYILYY